MTAADGQTAATATAALAPDKEAQALDVTLDHPEVPAEAPHSVATGNALHAAAEKVIEKGRRIAGHLMEVAADDIIFEAGSFTVAGTDRSIAISEVAAISFRPVLPPARSRTRSSRR